MRLIRSLDYFVFLVVLFSLPFGKSFFIPVLFTWLCLVFISYFVKRDYTLDRFKGLLVLPIILFLLHAMGVALSTHLHDNFSDLQFKLSLLLLPLLYPYQRESYRMGKSNLLWSFIAGCVSACLYYLGYAVYHSYSLVNGIWVFNSTPPKSWNNYFLGKELSYLIHPSYLALYLLVALLIIGITLKIWWKKGLVKITIMLAILILIACLMMLQSRAGLLGFGLLTLAGLIYLMFAKRKFLLGIIVFAGLLAIAFIVLNNINRYSNTIKSLKKTAEVGINSKSKEDGTVIRLWVWKSALSAIEKHPILGIGPSNVREKLHDEYIKRDMKAASSMKLNAHNQFLEIWLGLGIFGLLTLLAMLFAPLWIGIKKRDWLLVGFICLCSISFMFESMLETIAGIGFFAIFYTLLVSRLTNDQSEGKAAQKLHTT